MMAMFFLPVTLLIIIPLYYCWVNIKVIHCRISHHHEKETLAFDNFSGADVEGWRCEDCGIVFGGWRDGLNWRVFVPSWYPFGKNTFTGDGTRVIAGIVLVMWSIVFIYVIPILGFHLINPLVWQMIIMCPLGIFFLINAISAFDECFS